MTGALMAALDMSIVNVALPHMRGAREPRSRRSHGSRRATCSPTSSSCRSSRFSAPGSGANGSSFSRSPFSRALRCSAGLPGTSLRWSPFVSSRASGAGPFYRWRRLCCGRRFPEEQAKAMGIFGLGIILAPAFAPTLGGWLTDNYSWPWIFYINVPVGVLNILLIMRFIEDPPYLVREKRKIDFSGLFLMAVGLGAAADHARKRRPERLVRLPLHHDTWPLAALPGSCSFCGP